MKKIFITLFVLFTLVACGTPVTGVVVAKDYDRSYTRKYEKTERYACGTERYSMTTGKVTTRHTRTKYCNRTVPATQRVPEDWDVTVRDKDGREHEVDVDSFAFRQYNVGDTYPKATR